MAFPATLAMQYCRNPPPERRVFETMQHSGSPPTSAGNYRAKAGVLRQMAASEVTETLRIQLTNLALQYEQLADSLERLNSPVDERKNSD